MSPRTVFLSRLFGLYYILVGLSMFLHKQTDVQVIPALIRNAPVMFVVGILAVLGGLAMVLAHNIWSGGAVAVIVTLIGWILLAKGLLFLFLPPETEAGFFLARLHYEQLFYLYAAIAVVLGVYLTYAGFLSTSKS
jgi:hypothetical protein